MKVNQNRKSKQAEIAALKRRIAELELENKRIRRAGQSIVKQLLEADAPDGSWRSAWRTLTRTDR